VTSGNRESTKEKRRDADEDAEAGRDGTDPINRSLINSPMLPDLKKNADGSLTIHIQKDSPGKNEEANWLPAPNGPTYVVMRVYWPKESALNGTWLPPPVQRIE
jgi:hypothetical protein